MKLSFWTLPCSERPPHADYTESIGPYMLASMALQKGYSVQVYQATLYGCDSARISEEINASRPDMVAFSAYTPGLPLLASILARINTTPVVVGGPGVTSDLESARRSVAHRPFVALVQGEGEQLFERLLTTPPADWESIDKLCALDGHSMRNMNVKPFADLSTSVQRTRAESVARDQSVPLDERIRNLRSLFHSYIETRRGCFYHCEFCSEPWLSEKGVRKVTPERAVEEVAVLHNKSGITYFNFTDNIAFDNEQWWATFAELLASQPFTEHIQYGGYATPLFFSRGTWLQKTLPCLAQAGLAAFDMGVQSGSPRILKDIIRRPASDPENAYAVTQCAIDLGIKVQTDFIVGHPTETAHDLYLTLYWVQKLYEAGAQISARRLNVMPKTGYAVNLGMHKYDLPVFGEAENALCAAILAYHAKRKPAPRPRIADFIDRGQHIPLPNPTRSLEQLAEIEKELERAAMADMVKNRYLLMNSLYRRLAMVNT